MDQMLILSYICLFCIYPIWNRTWRNGERNLTSSSDIICLKIYSIVQNIWVLHCILFHFVFTIINIICSITLWKLAYHSLCVSWALETFIALLFYSTYRFAKKKILPNIKMMQAALRKCHSARCIALKRGGMSYEKPSIIKRIRPRRNWDYGQPAQQKVRRRRCYLGAC